MNRKGSWSVWAAQIASKRLFDIGKQETFVGFREINFNTGDNVKITGSGSCKHNAHVKF